MLRVSYILFKQLLVLTEAVAFPHSVRLFFGMMDPVPSKAGKEDGDRPFSRACCKGALKEGRIGPDIWKKFFLQ